MVSKSDIYLDRKLYLEQHCDNNTVDMNLINQVSYGAALFVIVTYDDISY